MKPIKPFGRRFPIRLGRLFFFACWALPASRPADFASRREPASLPFFPLPWPKFLFQSPRDASSVSLQRFAFQGIASPGFWAQRFKIGRPRRAWAGRRHAPPPFLVAYPAPACAAFLRPARPGPPAAAQSPGPDTAFPSFSLSHCAPHCRRRGSSPDDLPHEDEHVSAGSARRCRFVLCGDSSPRRRRRRADRNLLARSDSGQASTRRKKRKGLPRKKIAFFFRRSGRAAAP